MKNNVVILRPDRLNVPLAEQSVGRLSSAVFAICGDVPDDVASVAVLVGRTPDPTTQQPRPDFTVAASRTSGGWSCYLSPWCFPDASDELRYHVVATDAHAPDAAPRWLGTGALRVLENPANGSPVVPPLLPADSYVRNPLTGLYHKLVAELNALGEITITVEQEGIEQ